MKLSAEIFRLFKKKIPYMYNPTLSSKKANMYVKQKPMNNC